MLTSTRIMLTLGLLATAQLVHAQGAAGKVRQAIEETTNGKCSDVLSTMVKYACEQQSARMAETFKRLGRITDVSFKGLEATPNGQAEVYLATHQNGKMMWMVVVAPDGKLSTFWSPGPTQ